MARIEIEGECQGKATQFLGWCERKPSVVRDGKPYCWQHDPARRSRAAKERQAAAVARTARIEAEQDARIERRQLENQSGVDSLSNDDLRVIIAIGGIRSMIDKHRA